MIAARSASALKRCGWAVHLNKIRPRSSRNKAALEKGTMFHEAAQKWVETGTIPEVTDAEVAGWLEVFAASLIRNASMRCEVAMGLGPDGTYVPVTEPLPHVYDAGEGVALLTAGRADLVWMEGAACFVADYKTGVWPPEHPNTNLQLWALGMAAAQMLKAKRVSVGIYAVRDGAWDWSRPVLVGSDTWQAHWRDVKAAAEVGDEPRPGSNCAGCWEAKDCEHVVFE